MKPPWARDRHRELDLTGLLEPTRAGVLAWLERKVQAGRAFPVSPELGAYLLRELRKAAP